MRNNGGMTTSVVAVQKDGRASARQKKTAQAELSAEDARELAAQGIRRMSTHRYHASPPEDFDKPELTAEGDTPCEDPLDPAHLPDGFSVMDKNVLVNKPPVAEPAVEDVKLAFD